MSPPRFPSSRGPRRGPDDRPQRPQRSGKPFGGRHGHGQGENSRGPGEPGDHDRSSPPDIRGSFIARGVRIIHEDDQVIVVEKPAGLVTADPARAAGSPRGMNPSARQGQTLFDFIKRHAREHGRATRRRRERDDTSDIEDRAGRVWIIHRLDKEASGLLVFAKTNRAFESLKEQFRTKQAHRIYFAVAEGILGEPGFASTRQSFISEDRGNDGPGSRPAPSRADRRAPEQDGDKKFAVTHFRVVATGNDRSLLQVRLDTGRKNQIRVHMQELGHPLVGDARFGARADPIRRLGLHAAELGFLHPGTGQTVRYHCSTPASFYRAVGMDAPKNASDDEPSEGPQARRDQPGSPRPPAQPSAEPAGDDTSWDDVAQWYDELLEDRGNDHYERVILPAAMALLGDSAGQRILDVACGQGILCRRLLAAGAKVTGIDASSRLIGAAKNRSPEIDYRVGDARELDSFSGTGFDAATCIMALGNIDPIDPVFRGVEAALRPGGRFVAVISHPGFRIPGASTWGWDPEKNSQFRRLDAYLTPSKREIKMHPGKAAFQGDKTVTWSHHRPLKAYINALAAAGLHVDQLEELISLRAANSGPRAPEENRSRREIPLFLAIRAVKPEAKA